MNNKTLAPIPKGQVATLLGGVALVAMGFSAVWYGLLRQQARRDERGIYAPWEYRILQAQASAGNPTRPTMSHQSPGTTASQPDRPAPGVLATRRPSESDMGPESSHAHGDSAVPNALQTKSGASSADPNSGLKPGPGTTP